MIPGMQSAALRALRSLMRGRKRRGSPRRLEREPVSNVGAGGIDWASVLSVRIRIRGEIEPTYLRPARRFPGLAGVVPGSVRRRPRIMAVLDTSGSMEADVLAMVNRELPALARVGDVAVVECDDRVRSVRPYARPLGEVKGRGDTDLRPPFEGRILSRIRPDAVVYFTDGGGEAPKQPPWGVPVIWCLTPGGETPASWGVTLRLAERL